jgi:hypothetical protein
VNSDTAADQLIDYFVANPKFIRYKNSKIDAPIQETGISLSTVDNSPVALTVAASPSDFTSLTVGDGVGIDITYTVNGLSTSTNTSIIVFQSDLYHPTLTTCSVGGGSTSSKTYSGSNYVYFIFWVDSFVSGDTIVCNVQVAKKLQATTTPEFKISLAEASTGNLLG